MPFAPGERVHLRGLGTGTVREARTGGRYVLEIKGRIIVASEAEIESADPPPRGRAAPNCSINDPVAPECTQPHPARRDRDRPHQAAAGRTPSHAAAPGLDLHGKTRLEAIVLVEQFINDALLDGHSEVRVIHGRSGGRVKAALHQYLRALPTIATFGVDPRNPGVTIITFA